MMELRRAGPDDSEPLSELAVATFIEAYEGLLPKPELARFAERRFTPELTRAELAEEGSAFYLALSPDAGLCGYLKMRLHPAPAGVRGPAPIELARIYLRLRAQGRGWGGLLFEKARAHAREAACRTLWLSVWEKNEKALGFYRARGFAPAGTRDFLYYDERQTDLILERPVEA